MSHPEEHQDRLVDMLLRESVGKETPPDVRARVLEMADALPVRKPARPAPRPRVATLRLAQQPRSPGKLLAIAAVVALLGVAGVLVWIQQITASRTPLLSTDTRKDVPVAAGETVTSDAQSGALLTYPDGTEVRLAAGTTLRVSPGKFLDKAKRLEIRKGAVEATVSPQPAGSPMVFFSGDARAVVVGTRLSFRRSADFSRLEVSEGMVRFVPKSGESAVLVKAGYFAEGGTGGLQTGRIRGLTGFTLMNAQSDRPMREHPMLDGEMISLSSLAVKEINIRADFTGEPPTALRFRLTREDGQDTGLAPATSNDQKYPPFFAAGDHWADGRPEDCRAWTPEPGTYTLSAEAQYKKAPPVTLTLTFQIVD